MCFLQKELLSEAGQLVNLHHPHVVQLFGVVISPKKHRYEIVMEKLDCGLDHAWPALRREWDSATFYRRTVKTLVQVCSRIHKSYIQACWCHCLRHHPKSACAL